jgi:hypothetical protein
VYEAWALQALIEARTVVAKRNVIGKPALYVEDVVDLPAAKGFANEPTLSLE